MNFMIDEHLVPDEAIEAAAMALLAVTAKEWDLQTTGTKDRYRWDAKVALQAAAPHIAAAALEEAATRAIEQEMKTITPAALRRRARSYKP